MDRDELRGLRRWIEDDRTPIGDLLAKRQSFEYEAERIRDPDVRRSVCYLIRLIDDELQARDDLVRLRRSGS